MGIKKRLGTAFEVAEKELQWLKDTATDKQDRARIVGYEDCLRTIKNYSEAKEK